MNRTNIDWPGLTHTWNPVVGCKKGCRYCYARKMNDRFRWIPDFSEPQFFPERLNDPFKKKKPSSIFVGSMCDLFGDWVLKSWVMQILSVCYDSPWHNYWFLTKNPKKYNYLRVKWDHINCKLGVTITGKEPAWKQSKLMYDLLTTGASFIFVSIEPLLGPIYQDLSFADLVIVGPQTPVREQPKQEWLDSIKHNNIHYKDVKGWLNSPKKKRKN